MKKGSKINVYARHNHRQSPVPLAIIYSVCSRVRGTIFKRLKIIYASENQKL